MVATKTAEQSRLEWLASVGEKGSKASIKNIRWFWKHRIPLRVIGLLDGNPGDGKSQMVAYLAARVTGDLTFPDGSSAPQGGVIWVGSEDLKDETWTPRLIAAGADINKVLRVTEVPSGSPNVPGRLPKIPDDIDLFEQLIRYHDARMIVFDPVTPYLNSKVRLASEDDVREALTPLATMLERTNCFCLFLRHLNKDDKVSNAMYRGLHSIAFTAQARVNMGVARDKEDKEQLHLMWLKLSVGRKPRTIDYRIESAIVEGEQDTIVDTSRIEMGEESDHDADSYFTETGQKKTGTRGQAILKARRFLLTTLHEPGRWVTAAYINQEADKAGVAHATLHRAKEELFVETSKEGFEGGWSWRIPEGAAISRDGDGEKYVVPPAKGLKA